MNVTLEIFRDGTWVPAATLTPGNPDEGYQGSCIFDYTLPYATEFAGVATAETAGLSVRYPADFQHYNLGHWPAFVLDILPSGFGRRQWLEQLQLQDGPRADWPLLIHGAAYPPGNIRVAEAVAAKDTSTLVPTTDGGAVPMHDHPGFARDAILARSEAFVEYAFQHGIYAAGASDVQGVSPKLLLTQDHDGAWHAEGRLQDGDVASHWLVKRPRGDRADDRKVLRNEAAYMRVAQQLGLNTYAELEWEADNLFVPRFDRAVHEGSVERYGMESLCSAAGIADFGARVEQETLCDTILRYSSQPVDDLVEYIRRDIANVILGNKDNHARNTALLRLEGGRIQLAPLFDFAPMYLDPEGIARVCRWSGDLEQGGDPQWTAVIALYPEHQTRLADELRQFGHLLEDLPDTMRACGVDEDIIENRRLTNERHCRQLLEL